jgi:hypothetical protein
MRIGFDGIISRAQAEAAGFKVDKTCYPWVAYEGARGRPTRWFDILTDKEAQLLAALEAVEWAGGKEMLPDCPSCGADAPMHGRPAQPHDPACILALAIKAAKGDVP